MAAFIAIEGLDGSGGTTQLRSLSDWLQQRGERVLITQEPTRGPIGRVIRDVLSGRVGVTEGALPYLFAADRQQHVEREILPALEQGVWVVSDRYLVSSLAYQGIQMPMEKLIVLNSDFPLPDLTIYIDLDPKACMERVLARGDTREIFEVESLLERVHQNYMDALNWVRARAEVVVVNGSMSREHVANSITTAVVNLYF